jgi:hypothetical protein
MISIKLQIKLDFRIVGLTVLLVKLLHLVLAN